MPIQLSKKIVYFTVGEQRYRVTRIVENVTEQSIISSTTSPIETVDLTNEPSEDLNAPTTSESHNASNENHNASSTSEQCNTPQWTAEGQPPSPVYSEPPPYSPYHYSAHSPEPTDSPTDIFW